MASFYKRVFFTRLFIFWRWNRIKELRINEEIRVPEVRVTLEEGNEQVGVMPIKEAMQLAIEKGLDLVEISPTAKPPVCKIMDYGKYRFEQSKREKEVKKIKKHLTSKK